MQEGASKWPPYEVDEKAARAVEALGMTLAEGTKWLIAGFGPLSIRRYREIGLPLDAAVSGRGLGLGQLVYDRAHSLGTTPIDLVHLAEATFSNIVVTTDLVENLLSVPPNERHEGWFILLACAGEKMFEIGERIRSGKTAEADNEIRLVRESSKKEDVIRLLNSGRTCLDIRWESTPISRHTRALWRAYLDDPNEALMRTKNNHQAIDFFDGVPPTHVVDKQRPKEVLVLSDSPPYIVRESGKAIPAHLLNLKDNDYALRTEAIRLGFRITEDSAKTRFISAHPKAARVYKTVSRPGTRPRKELCGVIEQTSQGFRSIPFPDQSSQTGSFTSLSDSLANVLGDISRVVSLNIEPSSLDTNQLIAAINRLPLSSKSIRGKVGKRHLVSHVDSDEQRIWLVPKAFDVRTGLPVDGIGVIRYGDLCVYQPHEIALGFFPSESHAREMVAQRVPLVTILIDDDPILRFRSCSQGVERYGTSGVSVYPSLEDALHDTAELKLSLDDRVSVWLRDDKSDLGDLVLQIARSHSPNFSAPNVRACLVAGNGYDVISLNEVEYVAVPFVDDSYELYSLEDPAFGDSSPSPTVHSLLATYGEFESESRTSGYSSIDLGRLPDSNVVIIENIDDEPGAVHAFREPMSDVDAVLRWITFLDRFTNLPAWEIVERNFRRPGRIEFASDFNREFSSTLEITTELCLDQTEFAQVVKAIKQGR